MGFSVFAGLDCTEIKTKHHFKDTKMLLPCKEGDIK